MFRPRRDSTALVLALALGLSPSVPGQSGPQADEPQHPPVYDETADARRDIEVALARATKEHQRVLVVFGANWCVWCRKLDAFFRDHAEVRRELLYEYQVVKVDLGKGDKNTDLIEELGAGVKEGGLPYLTVLAADGSVVVHQDTGALETGPEHDANKVLPFLRKYQARVPDAEQVLKGALAEAKKSGRKLFVHLGAPWCGWCHRLEEFLAIPAVAEALGRDFVDVKIDIDRMPGGKEVQQRLRGSEAGGIPWCVILDAEGTEIITADGPEGNIGCPVQPAEISHFLVMLRTARKHLTDTDLDFIQRELERFARKIKAR